MSDCQHEWTVLIICSQIQVGRSEIRACRKCGLDASVQTTPAALAAAPSGEPNPKENR